MDQPVRYGGRGLDMCGAWIGRGAYGARGGGGAHSAGGVLIVRTTDQKKKNLYLIYVIYNEFDMLNPIFVLPSLENRVKNSK